MKKQRGFGALEVLICLIIASLATTAGAKIYGNYLDRQSNLQAGEQLVFVADAASKYIQDNYAAVVAVATATTPAVITPLMLRNTGYLQAGFSDTNAYGQSYQVLALEPTANKLETLIVTTGGDTIKELHMLEISKLVGARGGYISSTAPTIASGSFGGWSTALAPYGVFPGAGHLAAGLFFDDGALVTDYLYRNSVTGQPEVNRMNTAIDMATNNLNNVGTVNATTAAIAGDTTTAGETYTGGWFRAKGDGGIYNEKHNGGWYMSDPGWLRSWADKGVYTGGELRGGTVTSNGRATVGEYLELGGVATEGAACSPNGLIGRNTAGLTLSCQTGVWKGNSGAPFVGPYNDMTAARTFGVNYQNTSSGPRFVSVIGASGSVASQWYLFGYVNGSLVQTTSVSDAGVNWYNSTSSISFIVPAGEAYMINRNGAGAYITSWMELN